MKQLIQPNRSIVGVVGMCLQYVRQVYGRPAVEPTALVGWQRTQYKHHDRNHPRNLSVPLWWNFTDPSDGVNYGHVVWFDQTDGTYNSSPFDSKTGWYIGKSIDDITRQLQRFGAASYLGWSEDISGARVAEVTQGGQMIIQNAENWYGRCNDTHWRIRGRELARSTFNAYVGRDFLHFVEDCSDDPEAQRVQEWQTVGKLAVQDKWQQQIYDLQAQVKALGNRPTQAQVDELNGKIAAISAQMKSAQAEATQARKDAAESAQALERIEGETAQAKKEADNFLTALINSIRNIFGGK